MLLEQAGYAVISAEGFAQALEACKSEYDLIIMGHSIPRDDKRLIIYDLRQCGCYAPVLSLLRAGEEAIPEAVKEIDPHPQHVLDTVETMLTKHVAKPV